MRRALGLVLFAAFVAGPASAQETVRGNVNGEVEQPIVDKILECIELERFAFDEAFSVPQGQPLPPEQDAAVEELVDKATVCLFDAIGMLESAVPGGNLQPGSNAAAAIESLTKARKGDFKTLAALRRERPAGTIVKMLQKSIGAKRSALTFLQAGAVDPQAIEPSAAPDGLGFPMDEAGRLFLRAFGLDAEDARVSSGTDDSQAPQAKRFVDRYAAFSAKKRAMDAFGFLTVPRRLRGPFQARVTSGSFTDDEDARAALGTAFACIEFDVVGSDPLVFLAVCARPVNDGVQVFATSPTGSQGQAFLSGTDRAVLDVVYDGTTFTCRARRPADAPDAWTTFATWTRAQGADTWTAGIGAAQLSGAALLGHDDLAIWAIER